MPADIMSNTCRGENFGKSFSKKSSESEVKSGFLVLLGPGGMRQDVRVVVYRTSLEHFAVIYPRKRVAKPIGVVNLRNTAVEQAESNSGFIVRQKGYDNTISAKFVCSERDMESWMSAFTSRASPHCVHTSLPVLVETEES
uniref:PH domain-containing protein n=1 Tax=Heliothis virescens TaxID=7102 RepID=A0A2A4JVB4_HELVI